MEGQASAKGRHKAKNKKSNTKPKTPKKNRAREGPTCSMFLADLTRKLQLKRKHEEDVEMTKNIVHTIIDTIASALPITISKKSSERADNAPVSINQLQSLAPELLPRDTIEVPNLPKFEEKDAQHNFEVNEVNEIILFGDKSSKLGFKMPKMPLISSDMIKPKPRILGSMHDIAVNTGGDHDVASEIARHVTTLKKISLIAEEFNQKTAKNLKEIVDSVQEDLIKKLEEVKAEHREKEAAAAAAAAAAEVATERSETTEINKEEESVAD